MRPPFNPNSPSPGKTPGRTGNAMMAAMAGRGGAAFGGRTGGGGGKGVGFDMSMDSGGSSTGKRNSALTLEALAQRNGEKIEGGGASSPREGDEDDVVDELAFDESNNNAAQKKRDDDDDDDDSDEGDGSSRKQSSVFKQCKKTAKKCWKNTCDWGDGLPCGLTMTQIMAIIILVPIIFLVAYSSIPLSSAVRAQGYISSHKLIISDLVKAIEDLESERRDSSLIFSDDATNGSSLANLRTQMSMITTSSTTAALVTTSDPNSTSPISPATTPSAVDPRLQYDSHYPSTLIYFNKTAVQERLRRLRQTVDDDVQHLLTDMLDSDSSVQQSIIQKAEELLKEISTLRERVDAKRITGSELRIQYKTIQESYALMILELNRDPRASSVELQYVLFMLMLRNENSAAMMGDTMAAILLQSGETIVNLRNLQGAVNGLQNDIELLRNGGHAVELAAVQVITSAPSYERIIREYEAVFRVDGNASALDFTFLDQAIAYDEFTEVMKRVALNHLDYLNAGEELAQVVLTEVLKMIFAVIACILTAVVVILLNHREQKKMDKSLKDTRVLARAVQKFVPKNQLKMMGVKSITEVHPGLTKDVSRTLLSSSIRDFTKLAEEMESQDLFEWLQQYVSRMTHVVVGERGYIDTLVGDSILSVFVEAIDAVNAGINMHVSTEQLNLELVAQGVSNLVECGVGIHYCEVVAGVFGDNTRLSCTMVSSDVNLAPRLEALTRHFGAKIIASAAVIGQIDMDDYCVRCLGKIPISGSQQTVILFDVFQSDPVELKKHKTATVKEFEKAVRLSDKDANAALVQFEHISDLARKLGVIDVAAERRKQAGGGIGNISTLNAVAAQTSSEQQQGGTSGSPVGSRNNSFARRGGSPPLSPNSLDRLQHQNRGINNNNSTATSRNNSTTAISQQQQQQNQKGTPSQESATSGVLQTPGNESVGSAGAIHVSPAQNNYSNQNTTNAVYSPAGALPHSTNQDEEVTNNQNQNQATVDQNPSASASPNKNNNNANHSGTTSPRKTAGGQNQSRFAAMKGNSSNRSGHRKNSPTSTKKR